MDLAMAGMDGLSAARQLRARPETAVIPIVALSAAVHREAEADLYEVFDAVLHKPITRAELLDCLACWLTSDGGDAELGPEPEALQSPLRLPPALAEGLCALRPPFASINDITAFAATLMLRADETGDAGLGRTAHALRQAAEDFDLPALTRRLEALRRRTGCDDAAKDSR
jgi:CheY-like chemotaxis protein